MLSMQEYMDFTFKNLDDRWEYAVKRRDFAQATQIEAQKTEASHLYMEMLRRVDKHGKIQWERI